MQAYGRDRRKNHKGKKGCFHCGGVNHECNECPNQCVICGKTPYAECDEAKTCPLVAGYRTTENLPIISLQMFRTAVNNGTLQLGADGLATPPTSEVQFNPERQYSNMLHWSTSALNSVYSVANHLPRFDVSPETVSIRCAIHMIEEGGEEGERRETCERTVNRYEFRFIDWEAASASKKDFGFATQKEAEEKWQRVKEEKIQPPRLFQLLARIESESSLTSNLLFEVDRVKLFQTHDVPYSVYLRAKEKSLGLVYVASFVSTIAEDAVLKNALPWDHNGKDWVPLDKLVLTIYPSTLRPRTTLEYAQRFLNAYGICRTSQINPMRYPGEDEQINANEGVEAKSPEEDSD